MSRAAGLALRTFGTAVELETARTRLRPWRDDDLPAWEAMNADPLVRRHFATLATPAEARAEAARVRETIAARGWGMWALEVPGVHAFAGFVGLAVPGFEAPFLPAVEIGWRLARQAWGQGLATEAAGACVGFAFDRLGLDALVSFTAIGNLPSRRVMERLGMRESGEFDHPRLPPGHALARHVLYRLSRADADAARHRR